MTDVRLQVLRPAGEPALRHGPCAEDYQRRAKHMLLCGECGIILVRSNDDHAARDFVIICDNCGAINTDITRV